MKKLLRNLYVLSFSIGFHVTILSRLFRMIFEHLKIASSRQDNSKTTLRCLRNILLKTYQYRCLQEIFKKSFLDQAVWRQFTDILRMSWSVLYRPDNLKAILRRLENVLCRLDMSSKTTVNWLFNDVWCYLAISCFNWKIAIFQQAVVRIYDMFNQSHEIYFY